MFGSSSQSSYPNNPQTAHVLRLLANGAPSPALTAGPTAGLPLSLNDTAILQLLHLPTSGVTTTQALLSQLLLEQQQQQEQQQRLLRQQLLAEFVSPYQTSTTALHDLIALQPPPPNNNATPPIVTQQDVGEWEAMLQQQERQAASSPPQVATTTLRQHLAGSAALEITPAQLDVLAQRMPESHNNDNDKPVLVATKKNPPTVKKQRRRSSAASSSLSSSSPLPCLKNNNSRGEAKASQATASKEMSSDARPANKKRRTSKTSSSSSSSNSQKFVKTHVETKTINTTSDDADTTSTSATTLKTTLTGNVVVKPSLAVSKSNKKSKTQQQKRGSVKAVKTSSALAKPNQKKSKTQKQKRGNVQANSTVEKSMDVNIVKLSKEDGQTSNTLKKKSLTCVDLGRYRKSINGIAGGQSIMDIVLGRIAKSGIVKCKPADAEMATRGSGKHKDLQDDGCNKESANNNSLEATKKLPEGCWQPCDGLNCTESMEL